ncbi:hypothetical protein J4206_07110 [Candidatus Woesearchaeota archaeon]|nr:hypothetical protein [Candidatus Woesearchaeota archaeon]
MKCELCKKQIEELFLKKLKGTYIKDSNGKKHAVCFECQKNLGNDKEEILTKIGV